MTFLEILKYVDCFGTSFNFYTEKNRKLYTKIGGLLSIFSIILGAFIFININLDNFSHNNPNSTTSIKKGNYRKIKPKEEKIWIPWRIRDFAGKTVNHKDILYPIIYYYKAIRNKTSNNFDITYEHIGYKLCNETTMKNNSNLYMIDIELDQLYCIDMDDLDIGGSWDSDFLDLITLDIYTCKNGIDYDENNKNCTSYENIVEAAGKNDCFEFEMYYPVIQYQPMNKTTPIFVRYINHFYHFSRFSNKIDRLYLQEYILKDDIGWVNKKEITYSNWGSASLNGDSYATGNKRDLMNEGSTSRLYSFNIYLKSDIVFYNRSYKKLSLIVAEGLPIVNAVFILFKIIAKIFKISSRNKKLTELLFENLKKKKIKINNGKFKAMKLKSKNKNEEKKINSTIQVNDNYKNKSIIINNHFSNNIIKNDFSYIKLNENDSRQNIIIPKTGINYTLQNKKNNSLTVIEQIPDDKRCRSKKSSNNNINYYKKKNLNLIHKSKLEDLFSIKSNDLVSNFNFSDNMIINNYNKEDKSKTEKNIPKEKNKIQYIKKPLFPYRYYLFSIFIKKIDITRKYLFFSKKFIIVYNFICQLFDISSYLILQKEFEIMKNTVLVEQYREVMESRKKVNVNDLYFNTNMKECLSSQKFSILGQLHHMKK